MTVIELGNGERDGSSDTWDLLRGFRGSNAVLLKVKNVYLPAFNQVDNLKPNRCFTRLLFVLGSCCFEMLKAIVIKGCAGLSAR
jgi:hypothetical protein